MIIESSEYDCCLFVKAPYVRYASFTGLLEVR